MEICLEEITTLIEAIQTLFEENIKINQSPIKVKKDKPKAVYEPIVYGGLLTKQTGFFQFPSISE
jgi:hypothetical protein